MIQMPTDVQRDKFTELKYENACQFTYAKRHSVRMGLHILTTRLSLHFL